MKYEQTDRRMGMTLVELLTVIAIISILVGLLTASVVVAKSRAAEAKAKSEVRELVRAWNAYWMMYGKFPAAFEGVTNAEMTAANVAYLLGRVGADNPNGHRFLDPKVEVAAGGFKDPWGNFYRVDFSKKTVPGADTYEATVQFPQRRRYDYESY